MERGPGSRSTGSSGGVEPGRQASRAEVDTDTERACWTTGTGPRGAVCNQDRVEPSTSATGSV
jgi:hypothetical protein